MTKVSATQKFFLRWLNSVLRTVIWPVIFLVLIISSPGFLIFLESLGTQTRRIFELTLAQYNFLVLGHGTLELLRIIAWPATVLIVSWYFKEVFAYLFFSMKEYNFFGAKGKLKSITQVIDERATEQFRSKMQNLEIAKEREKREKTLKDIEESNRSKDEKIAELLRVGNEQSSKISSLEKDLNEEKKKAGEIKKKATDEVIDHIFAHYDIKRRPPSTAASTEA